MRAGGRRAAGWGDAGGGAVAVFEGGGSAVLIPATSYVLHSERGHMAAPSSIYLDISARRLCECVNMTRPDIVENAYIARQAADKVGTYKSGARRGSRNLAPAVMVSSKQEATCANAHFRTGEKASMGQRPPAAPSQKITDEANEAATRNIRRMVVGGPLEPAPESRRPTAPPLPPIGYFHDAPIAHESGTPLVSLKIIERLPTARPGG